ncbi:o-succinylbenzoate synthase [Spirulina sp. 06S082]|uniref:o-succinylbenzoate synthase n=1 Tax=Spirulina sp. 06S082 TaxID=3110248 RepID=UPI002B20AED5|nr:o-succinylbenzoate synthase [Spirulina sp. 06S082]MEA5470746.1 o-succinylbenzoate synthase [Spirulina sp. 06S082]
MVYQVGFEVYQYPFKQPLQTHHGTWDIREGIIVELVDEKRKRGRGEIAPIPWFGSETLAQALQFMQQLRTKISREDIFTIPDRLPACQFAFESALQELEQPEILENNSSPSSYSYLLPAGKLALQQWQIGYEEGGRTFKWKIGVTSVAEELKILQQLTQALPIDVTLRLDANGGLNLETAKHWLEAADRIGNIEFIEQPLPPQNLSEMIKLQTAYATDIALDESVATLTKLEQCYQEGWRGIYVIKAAIAGSPQRLRRVCQEYAIDAVFSSVFETDIGRKTVLQLARELSSPQRAVGFGIDSWFDIIASPFDL